MFPLKGFASEIDQFSQLCAEFIRYTQSIKINRMINLSPGKYVECTHQEKTAYESKLLFDKVNALYKASQEYDEEDRFIAVYEHTMNHYMVPAQIRTIMVINYPKIAEIVNNNKKLKDDGNQDINELTKIMSEMVLTDKQEHHSLAQESIDGLSDGLKKLIF